MLLTNLTPFAALAFRQFDHDGGLDAVVAVRGAFVPVFGAAMTPSRRRAAIQRSDEYAGDPRTTPLLRSTDLAPYKPGTDITYLGTSRAPSGAPSRRWIARLAIADRLDRALRVTGPRFWAATERQGRWAAAQWAVSEPEPVGSVPLCWTRALGGPPLGGPSETSHPWPLNPIGMGLLDERADPAAAYPAPQIEAAEKPIAWPSSDLAPAGFGPVPPWWPQRFRFAGTYDQAWRDTRHPLLPGDFDDRFWQAAAPGMVVEPWLQGDESYRLETLHPDRAMFDGTLPGCRCVVRVHRPDHATEDRELALDGVHFDVRAEPVCFLTWRVCFPMPDARAARLVLRVVGMSYQRIPREQWADAT